MQESLPDPVLVHAGLRIAEGVSDWAGSISYVVGISELRDSPIFGRGAARV